MKYRNIIKIPDALTLANLAFGVLSIIFSINNNFLVAAIMMLGSVLFDLFDGKVARWTKRQGDFGKQLDSLSDLVSFGVAPAIFALQFSGYQTINILIALFFVCAGALRLARFNITEMKGYYSGLPITNAGWIIPAWYFLGLPYMIFLVILIGVLFIIPLRIKKVI
jgi:CDP-diacylglycerol--serine O-phosphatidyltransferase